MENGEWAPTHLKKLSPQRLVTDMSLANSLMAIGDEDGGIKILESSAEKGQWSTPYLKFRPHQNAILDIAFSPDDLAMSTASGDQQARVVDMMTQTATYTMAGHFASVKQAKFQPVSVDSTGMLKIYPKDVK